MLTTLPANAGDAAAAGRPLTQSPHQWCRTKAGAADSSHLLHQVRWAATCQANATHTPPRKQTSTATQAYTNHQAHTTCMRVRVCGTQHELTSHRMPGCPAEGASMPLPTHTFPRTSSMPTAWLPCPGNRKATGLRRSGSGCPAYAASRRARRCALAAACTRAWRSRRRSSVGLFFCMYGGWSWRVSALIQCACAARRPYLSVWGIGFVSGAAWCACKPMRDEQCITR